MNTILSGLERQRQIEDYEEVRGFDLSPVHPLHTEQDYSQGAHSQRGEYSQSLRGEHSQSHRGGFETSHTEDTEMYLPVTQVVSFFFRLSEVKMNELSKRAYSSLKKKKILQESILN